MLWVGFVCCSCWYLLEALHVTHHLFSILLFIDTSQQCNSRKVSMLMCTNCFRTDHHRSQCRQQGPLNDPDAICSDCGKRGHYSCIRPRFHYGLLETFCSNWYVCRQQSSAIVVWHCLSVSMTEPCISFVFVSHSHDFIFFSLFLFYTQRPTGPLLLSLQRTGFDGLRSQR